eukprot:scaffold105769_cov16-Tisochrysis_lutea.AAC.1
MAFVRPNCATQHTVRAVLSSQVMDTFVKAQLREASGEDLANPAALVLPDVQHLLLLGATTDPDLGSSSISSSSKSENGKQEISGEGPGSGGNPPAATALEPSLAETSM